MKEKLWSKKYLLKQLAEAVLVWVAEVRDPSEDPVMEDYFYITVSVLLNEKYCPPDEDGGSPILRFLAAEHPEIFRNLARRLELPDAAWHHRPRKRLTCPDCGALFNHDEATALYDEPGKPYGKIITCPKCGSLKVVTNERKMQ